MIELINITKNYLFRGKAINVLSDVNIRIEKGESVCMRGQSGTGKTTLLNIIGGMLAPTSGIVKINGLNLTNIPQNFLSEYRRKEVGKRTLLVPILKLLLWIKRFLMTYSMYLGTYGPDLGFILTITG